MIRRETTLRVPGGEVSALILRPESAFCLYVLAHGAGAGMRHPFLEAAAEALAARGVATLRYNFPYAEAGRRRPDRKPALLVTVRAAVEVAAGEGLPLVAGGKSMGGRMTSLAYAERPLSGVRGLCFLGFPLHPPRRPSDARAEHLGAVHLPMLFVQGTRDDLASLELLRPVCARLGARATLHLVDGADHSFHLLRRSGRTDADALGELAEALARWARPLC